LIFSWKKNNTGFKNNLQNKTIGYILSASKKGRKVLDRNLLRHRNKKSRPVFLAKVEPSGFSTNPRKGCIDV
jgi:hypothetical protein